MTTTNALRGLRVLEHSDGDGAAYLGRIMADHGASVTRIVPAGSTKAADPLAAARDVALHHGKDTFALDLDGPDAESQLDALLAAADVVAIGGWSLDDVHPLLQPARLSAQPCGFVLATVFPYGATGPGAHRPATPLTLSAAGGLMSVTGTPDAPRRPWGRQEMYLAGILAYTGAVAALLARNRPADRVTWVDVSAQEAAIVTIEAGFVFESFLHVTRKRAGATNPLGYPYEVFPCADGYVMAAIGHDWEYFAEVLGEPELVDDRFLTLEGRLMNRAHLDVILTRAFARFTREDLMAIGQAVRCPFGVVYSVLEVPGLEHWQRRGSFVKQEDGLQLPRSAIGALFHAERHSALTAEATA